MCDMYLLSVLIFVDVYLYYVNCICYAVIGGQISTDEI